MTTPATASAPSALALNRPPGADTWSASPAKLAPAFLLGPYRPAGSRRPAPRRRPTDAGTILRQLDHNGEPDAELLDGQDFPGGEAGAAIHARGPHAHANFVATTA